MIYKVIPAKAASDAAKVGIYTNEACIIYIDSALSAERHGFRCGTTDFNLLRLVSSLSRDNELKFVTPEFTCQNSSLQNLSRKVSHSVQEDLLYRPLF